MSVKTDRKTDRKIDTKDHAIQNIRTAHDAGDDERLRLDPSDEDAKLDVALDESFPTSDAPSNTRPGNSDPAPSSGYDEEAEKARMKGKE